MARIGRVKRTALQRANEESGRLQGGLLLRVRGGQSPTESVTDENSVVGGGKSSTEPATHESSMATVNEQSSMEAMRKFAEFHWPDDVVMRIMAFLPLVSLFRFRAVSPQWNALVLEPQFQRLRQSLQPLLHLFDDTPLQQLVKCVIHKFGLGDANWGLNFGPIASGFLTVIKSENVLVLQPLRLSARLLPRLEFPRIKWIEHLSVLGLVITEATQDFAVFVTFKFFRTYCNQDRVLPVGQRRKDMTLHRYNSTTNAWTACGKGLHRNSKRRKIQSMTMHRGQYMALMRNHYCPDRINDDIVHYNYDVYYFNEFKWKILSAKLPGELPGVFPGDVEGLQAAHDKPDGISIFDHRGKLYLANPSEIGCSLRKYDDDAVEWILVRKFQSPVRLDVGPEEQCWDEIELPFSHQLGDCLHFGGFKTLPRDRARGQISDTKTCRMLMFNLVTGKLTYLDKSDEAVRCLLARRCL